MRQTVSTLAGIFFVRHWLSHSGCIIPKLMQNQGIMNYMCSHQSKFRDEQENELFSQLNKAKLAENNDDCHRIRNILVEKNLGLVRKIIRQDYYQNHDSGMTEDDLMQEGAIGLMKAIERFDSTRGRFSTYAWIWIRQSISRALENKARGIRVPAEWLKKEQMNESQNDNAETLQPEYKDRIFVHVPRLFYSLDNSKNDTAETALTNYVCNSVGPEEQAVQNEREEQVKIFLGKALNQKLTHRETEVIQRRFGLSGQIESSRTEVGKQLGLSRQRIAQVEGNALMKLRQVVNGQLSEL